MQDDATIDENMFSGFGFGKPFLLTGNSFSLENVFRHFSWIDVANLLYNSSCSIITIEKRIDSEERKKRSKELHHNLEKTKSSFHKMIDSTTNFVTLNHGDEC